MTDKAPERIWALVSSVWNGWYQNISHKGPTREFPVTEYVRADLLEAAQARIAELEAALIMRLSPSVAIDAKINVNAPKRFRATVKHEGTEVGDLPWLEEFWAIRHENHVSALATARAEALEEAARVLDLHESVPCKPAFPDAWSDEAKDAYENGQLDAAISWQSAIRALKGGSNG